MAPSKMLLNIMMALRAQVFLPPAFYVLAVR
jgi:hypothetical protein